MKNNLLITKGIGNELLVFSKDSILSIIENSNMKLLELTLKDNKNMSYLLDITEIGNINRQLEDDI